MKKLVVIYFLSTLVLGTMQSCRYRPQHHNSHNAKRTETTTRTSRGDSDRVKIRRENGVLFIPVEINGIPMDFIFDTGASSVSMSLTEAIFMYKQGRLTDDDILGSQQFQDATGHINEGTIINLRSVVIGNREVKNVQASVVENQEAPLLLGQTVLKNFGKVTIDYDNDYITFD